MRTEERKILDSLVLPFLFVFILWAIRIVEVIGNYDLAFLGIFPRSWSGLIGVLTGPLVHENFSHLLANTVLLKVWKRKRKRLR